MHSAAERDRDDRETVNAFKEQGNKAELREYEGVADAVNIKEGPRPRGAPVDLRRSTASSNELASSTP